MGRFISSVMEEPNSHKCVGICWHFIAALHAELVALLHCIHVILQSLNTKICLHDILCRVQKVRYITT